eukprot:10124780-Prorocentrum_lima.AAC.1
MGYERLVAIFISQKDAIEDFGQAALDTKLWKRMTVLDLHTRELYYDSLEGVNVKMREYVVLATAS